MIELQCPNCDRPLAGEDVNLTTGLARCRACDLAFSIQEHRDVVRAGRPKYVIETDLGRGVELRWRWIGWMVVPLAGFCIFWNGFLVFWYFGVANILSRSHSPAAWIMAIFPILHVGVGVMVAYQTLTMLFNRTVVRIADGMLTIRHGPIRARGNVSIPMDSIVSLRSVMERHNRGMTTQALHATLRDGTTLPVLRRQTDETLIDYVGQLLAERTGTSYHEQP